MTDSDCRNVITDSECRACDVVRACLLVAASSMANEEHEDVLKTSQRV